MPSITKFALAAAAAPLVIATNFNECLPRFGGLEVCAGLIPNAGDSAATTAPFPGVEGFLDSLGPETIPTITSCCKFVREFYQAKSQYTGQPLYCGCHDAFNVLSENSLDLIGNVCRNLARISSFRLLGLVRDKDFRELRKEFKKWGRRSWFGFYHEKRSIVGGTTGLPLLAPESVQRDSKCVKNVDNSPLFNTFVSEDNESCPIPDTAIEGARLLSTLSFNGAVTMFSQQCVEYNSLVEAFLTVSTPDLIAEVPFGVGVYKGVRQVVEYLAISISGVNHGLWDAGTEPNPAAPGNFVFSNQEGSEISFLSAFQGAFLRGEWTYEDFVLGFRAQFRGCNTKFSKFIVPPSPGLGKFAEVFSETSVNSTRYGIDSICKIHDTYCANTPYQQWSSNAECKSFMSSLPIYTEQCGPLRPLGGNSLPCRFKHHLMVPSNPELHCAHMGDTNLQDLNNDLKCNDDVECPIGSDPVLCQAQMPFAPREAVALEAETTGCYAKIDPVNTDDEIRAAVQRSNLDEDGNPVDVNDEPLGCGIRLLKPGETELIPFGDLNSDVYKYEGN